MTPRRPWTTAEIRKIRELGRHHDVHAIAKKLGRTSRSVESAARRAGISMVALRAWTEAEDQAIREHAHRLTAAKIGRRLNRSADAVKRRAKELGVSLQRRGQFHHAAKHGKRKRAKYQKLRAAGLPKQTAARAVGVHPATARRWELPT